MTPKEAKKAFQAIEHKVRPFNGCLSVELKGHLYNGDDEPPLHAYIYVPGPGPATGKIVVDCNADDFDTLAERVDRSWECYAAGAMTGRIKSMALAIISITDEAGICTDAALRQAGFGAEEIADLAAEATGKAGEMADNGPFSVIHGDRSNGR